MNKFMRFSKNEKVLLNTPNDAKYNGLTAFIDSIDADDNNGLTYYLRVMDRMNRELPTKIWLPERLLLPFKERTLLDLVPGDILLNRAGLEFEILEPLSPVYFISPIGAPSVTIHTTADDLLHDGYRLKGKTKS